MTTSTPDQAAAQIEACPYHALTQRLPALDCMQCRIVASQSIMRSVRRSAQWKLGDEFKPYHPQASHVEPAYRDGWNACFEAARRELLARQVPDWMPIETAPKDGTPILLRSKKGRIADGCWLAATNSVGGWAWAYVRQEPVDWMPLPAAPTAAGAGEDT